MANYYSSGEPKLDLTIPEAVTDSGVTFYLISAKSPASWPEGAFVQWQVKRRYRDFASLHTSLVDQASGVDKEALPPRRLLGNRDPAFIMKRRKDLESYLQGIFQFLCRALPEVLIEFLELDRYDVHFVTRRLAAEHHDKMAMEVTDQADSSNSAKETSSHEPDCVEALETFEEIVEDEDTQSSDDLTCWTPLEMHAISQRLRSAKPPPPDPAANSRHDFANVAERVCQLSSLKLTGHGREPLGTSDLSPDSLPYDFLAFRSLTHLVLERVVLRADLITSMGSVRKTLIHLTAQNCSLESISQMLLCDVEHERGNDKALNSVALADSSARERLSWSALRHLDLRSNRIRRVDVSLKLAPALATLKLGRNELSRIETNLSQMSQLTSLDLSSNLIEEISTEEVKDLNLFRLDVAGNRLRTLDALASVSTLASVDASANRIAELADIEEVCRLPAIVCLNLQGNKVTRIVDYRLKVLERFGQRCSELCLDSETPSQSEVDKVSVRMAMKVAKEGGDHTALFGNLPRRVATSSNH